MSAVSRHIGVCDPPSGVYRSA